MNICIFKKFPCILRNVVFLENMQKIWGMKPTFSNKKLQANWCLQCVLPSNIFLIYTNSCHHLWYLSEIIKGRQGREERQKEDCCYWAIFSSWVVISLNYDPEVDVGRDECPIWQIVGNLEQKHLRNSAALWGGTWPRAQDHFSWSNGNSSVLYIYIHTHIYIDKIYIYFLRN